MCLWKMTIIEHAIYEGNCEGLHYKIYNINTNDDWLTNDTEQTKCYKFAFWLLQCKHVDKQNRMSVQANWNEN